MFGYGSIMNRSSLEKTLDDPSTAIPATLVGYQRKCNAEYGGYLYMNIVSQPTGSIDGVLVPVTDYELARMKKREVGYEAVDVTEHISTSVAGRVVVFMAPDTTYDPEFQVPRSYLATCTRDMSEIDRQKWIADTIIENLIYDDLEKPVYENASF